MRLNYLLLTALALGASAISADATAQTVYKFVDKNGNLVFSDTPVDGAEAVEIKPVSTVQMKPAGKIDFYEKKKEAATGYTRVAITTPSHETVFTNEAGPVLITGMSDPGLQAEHMFRLTVNGKTVGTPQKSPSFTLESPERGSHTAVLEIVDANLHAHAHSAPVTFHIQRHSKLFKPPTAPAPRRQP